MHLAAPGRNGHGLLFCAAVSAEVLARFARSATWRENGSPFPRSHMGRGFSFPDVTTPHPGEPRMAAKPVTAKLRLHLELIAALPEPILLDRLRRLSVVELILFRRFYGIRECRCQGPCQGPTFHAPRHQRGEAGAITPPCCSA